MASILDDNLSVHSDKVLLDQMVEIINESYEDIDDLNLTRILQIENLSSRIMINNPDYKIEIPKTYHQLMNLVTKYEKHISYLKTHEYTLEQEKGKLEGTVIALNGKIKVMEIMMGWFINEISKLKNDPTEVDKLNIVMEAHNIPKDSIKRVDDYSEQFKELK